MDDQPKEGGRSLPFDIDLNELPVCSPRETVPAAASSSAFDDVPPLAGKGATPAEAKEKVVILDMNALPSDAEGEETCELVDSGMHTVRDTTIGKSNNPPVTCSNLLFMGNQFDLMKASDTMTSIFKSSPVDCVQHRVNFGRHLKEADLSSLFIGRHQANDYSAHRVDSQNLSEKFLQSLRQFLFDKHGILQDGWSVEFFNCQKSCKPIPIYCSPDGNKFKSMSDVAYHLGLVSNSHSLASQDRRDGLPLVQNRLHSYRRRKESLIFSRNKDFKECQENLKSSFAGEFSLGIETMDVEVHKSSNLRAKEANSERTIRCSSSKFKDAFPVQFEDFLILSLGEVDSRPSYHKSNQIWPVGFKSTWHDKITGSLFVCDVTDGGDSGPIFKVQRYPCSSKPILVGSTVLTRPSCHTDKSKMDATMALEDREYTNVQMMLSDISPPHIDFNCVLSFENALAEVSNSQAVDDMQTDSNCVAKGLGEPALDIAVMGEVIGEFLVEGRSSSSVWRMVSQNLVHACHEVYKKTGVCKLFCTHNTNDGGLLCVAHESTEATRSTDSLAKFCHMCGSSSVVPRIQSNDELSTCCEAMAKWLDQDRFGLDIEFVQEMIEQLPGVQACSDYKFLDKRSDNSIAKTVRSGFLLAETNSHIFGSRLTDRVAQECQKHGKQVVKNSFLTGLSPPGMALSSKLPTNLIGDALQSWELLWRFSEVLGLEELLPFKELVAELIECSSVTLRSAASAISGKNPLITEEAECLRASVNMRHLPDACCSVTSATLTKAHCSLLRVLLVELHSKLTAFVDPNLEGGESKSRKRRRKEADHLIFAKKTMLDLLPINELTWPELARRYMLTFSSMGGNLDSVENVNRESSKVFQCLQGDSGAFYGSLPGVAGMEADALLLAEATKQIFGSSKNLNVSVNVDSSDIDGPNASKTVNMTDGEIPEWAQVLEPVRKLPTNVGARIRKCIYEALDRNPPEWARKILEYSISKEVYKGNASGPTKKAVLSLLAEVCGESRPQKPIRKRKTKCAGSSSDVIMKVCRKVLRLAAAADEDKVFCNLVGRTLSNTSDNDDEGFLGFPTMVSRPLDFRTVDLRLAFGAYGGSHEAFLEDVREVWHHIRTAYADQSDLVRLAETLAQNFEELYEKEVISLISKLTEYATVECLSSEAKKEMEDLIEHASEIPKAPWDEGVCKICGIDKDDDNVLLCDKCDSGYHTYCLNPPLMRIPDGNWYCPSCVTGHCITQAASQVPAFTSQCVKKRCQGEFTRGILNMLAHLGETMEVKDYWEYTIEQRIFLLKFLGDEMLNATNTREHLEQCASTVGELQQKLRVLYTDWRNLKFREEAITEKFSKETSSVLVGIGKPGTGGMGSVIPNFEKLMPQPHNKSSSCASPSNDLVCLEDGMQLHKTFDFTKQPWWFNQKVISEQHSSSGVAHLVKLPESWQVNQQSGNDKCSMLENSCSKILPSHVKDEIGVQKKVPSAPQRQRYDMNGDLADWGNFKKDVELRNWSGLMLPTCEFPQDHVSSGTTHMNSENVISSRPSFDQADANELQTSFVEASFIKSRIATLEDSISCLESQLQKVSLRKEFLGRDSAGRLYWAFSRPGSSPWVVVEGSMMWEKRDASSSNLTWSSSSQGTQKNLLKFKGSNVSSPYATERTDGIPVSSEWFSYQSDAEIEELMRWLRENESMEKDLLESLLQRVKVGYVNSSRTGNYASDAPSKRVDVEKIANSKTLVTRALASLEKKYGPCLEVDSADITMTSQNAAAATEETMCRCECLEPIWSSRHHCHMCHHSFPSKSELKDHHGGKCSSGMRAFKNSKGNDGILKGKAKMGIEQEEGSDKKRMENSGGRGHGTANGLSELLKDTPFDFEEICAKFITNNSNKELVAEIGLIGSKGVPSFVTCASPYLDDRTLILVSLPNEENPSPKSHAAKQFQQGIGITSKRHITNSDNSPIGVIADGIHEELRKTDRSNTSSEKRDQSSKRLICPKLGSAKISAIRDSSLRPLVGRGAQILRQLKINLFDMDAALPEDALKPSKASLEKRFAWRTFVKSAKSVFEMVQAAITLEDKIKTDYLKKEWWYWSSISAAARIATVSALALRIYTLDAAILYDKTLDIFSSKESAEVGSKKDNIPSSHMESTNIPKSSSESLPKANNLHQTDNGRRQSKSGKKRKDPG